MAQKAVAAHQATSNGTPQANLRFARGPGATPRNLRLARGLDASSGESPPRSRARRSLRRIYTSLEGLTPSRANLRPARGTGTSEKVSISLEAALDARRRTCSPDRSIKFSGTSRTPRSKANPHHAGALTLPGNYISALFDQPALCGHSRRYAGRPVSFHDTVPPTPVPLPRRPLGRGRWNPRKGYDHLPRIRLGRRREVRPAERVSSVTFGLV
jgi:hypothetical protein